VATFTNLIDMVRRLLRSGNSTSQYPDQQIADAVLLIGYDFVNRTRCTRFTSTLNLTNNSAAVDASAAALSTFRAEYLCDDPKAWITVSGVFTAAVEIVDRQTVFDLQLNRALTTAPKDRSQTRDYPRLAWLRNDAGSNAAVIWPTIPNDAVTYVLNLLWDPPFCQIATGVLASISVGQSSGTSTLNVPEEFILPCVPMMAYTVQGNTPEAVKRDPTVVQEYEAHVARCSGRGNLGVTSIHRESSGGG
jgi:hypothetical protein